MQFTVNGEAVTLELDPNTKLVYVLRNDLKLKATRFGCGTGHCGACTVLLDGEPVQSCDLPLWSLRGKQVVTLEGLGSVEAPHPVQQAFIDEQAAQCGYCINGIMMSIAALLKKSDAPTDDELLAALDRHLCRCGTHLRILNAARRALSKVKQAAR